MKRTPLARKSQLRAKARKPRAARKPIAKVNLKRKASEFVKRFGSRARCRAIAGIGCLVCGTKPAQNAHAKSRGAGGTWEHVVPLCSNHHREQHIAGTVFYKGMLYTKDDFLGVAELLARSLPADGGGE